MTHYTFLDEFELLPDTHNDIRAKPWAQPLAREAMKKLRQILRACEELVRCNTEIRRLHTSRLHENAFLDRALVEARSRGDILSGPLELLCFRRMRVNVRLLAVLSQIHELDGFTGAKTPGRRKGASGPSGNIVSLTMDSDLQRELEEMGQDQEDGAVEDADMADLAKLVDFTVNIS